MMQNKVALSLGLPDTDTCLQALAQVGSSVGTVEICLDLMSSFDLEQLVLHAPCPLIISCRPTREGGGFSGSEKERLAILNAAARAGCTYIDIEWDALQTFCASSVSDTRIIASRHWVGAMPSYSELWSTYQTLKEHADIVKLVGSASRWADIAPICDFLRTAVSPVIGIAMGANGQLSRILAPCFPSCFLTYVALHHVTAPGQILLQEAEAQFHLRDIASMTAVHLHLCARDIGKIAGKVCGEELYISMYLPVEEIHETVTALKQGIPSLQVTADIPLHDLL